MNNIKFWEQMFDFGQPIGKCIDNSGDRTISSGNDDSPHAAINGVSQLPGQPIHGLRADNVGTVPVRQVADRFGLAGGDSGGRVEYNQDSIQGFRLSAGWLVELCGISATLVGIQERKRDSRHLRDCLL